MAERDTKQWNQLYARNKNIPDFEFEDPQLQEVLTSIRNALIESEGLANNIMQRTVKVEDLVNAGICSVVNGKLVSASGNITDPETKG